MRWYDNGEESEKVDEYLEWFDEFMYEAPYAEGPPKAAGKRYFSRIHRVSPKQ